MNAYAAVGVKRMLRGDRDLRSERILRGEKSLNGEKILKGASEAREHNSIVHARLSVRPDRPSTRENRILQAVPDLDVIRVADEPRCAARYAGDELRHKGELRLRYEPRYGAEQICQAELPDSAQSLRDAQYPHAWHSRHGAQYHYGAKPRVARSSRHHAKNRHTAEHRYSSERRYGAGNRYSAKNRYSAGNRYACAKRYSTKNLHAAHVGGVLSDSMLKVLGIGLLMALCGITFSLGLSAALTAGLVI